jgi:hypothetical protein
MLYYYDLCIDNALQSKLQCFKLLFSRNTHKSQAQINDTRVRLWYTHCDNWRCYTLCFVAADSRELFTALSFTAFRPSCRRCTLAYGTLQRCRIRRQSAKRAKCRARCGVLDPNLVHNRATFRVFSFLFYRTPNPRALIILMCTERAIFDSSLRWR